MTAAPQPTIRTAEFFAGIGLVREALECLGVEVVWANDIDAAKGDAYAANHAATHFHLGDVRRVTADDLPADVDLATSSFPCVDLSLAGKRRGLNGDQSGMFWEFARVVDEMREARPPMVLLENVPSFASSNNGQDLADALTRLAVLGYSCDVFTVDARHFVPQSRPRMFIVGVRGELPAHAVRAVPPLCETRPPWVRQLHERHRSLGMHYLPLPPLPTGPVDLSAILQRVPHSDPPWWDRDLVDAFTNSLSATQTRRMEALRDAPVRCFRTAYRRTRKGIAVWEMRRDAIAGCLRTTGGGSSRQAVAELGNGEIRVRWMTPLEYARLMGAGSYMLRSGTPNQALFGFGDAVVVDVIRWIGEHYLLPTLRAGAVIKAA